MSTAAPPTGTPFAAPPPVLANLASPTGDGISTAMIPEQKSGYSFAPSQTPTSPPGLPLPALTFGIDPDEPQPGATAAPAVPQAVVATEDALSQLSGLGRVAPEPEVQTTPVTVAPAVGGEAAYQRATTEQQVDADDISLPEVLDYMLAAKASDLHLTAGTKPTIRVNGSLQRMEDYPDLTPQMIQRVMYGAITQLQRERFERELELDFSYTLPEKGRFRVNLYRQRDSLGAAFRMIPFEIKSLEALGVPPIVRDFAAMPRGFVLVTGPTGSGKSTTLASLIDHANSTRQDHIMTVEDPIEFMHSHKACLVNQREVGSDTQGFTAALKHVLRQDPDIILVGEMRDLETISVALTAAETGHLVFATLHTQDAAQTIDRVIDVFPPHQQQQVRQQLAGSLQGVVCQTLCKTQDGRGRVVATEVLIVTPAVRNLIREGKTHQIYSAMQAGAKHGMHTLDQHLAKLVREGRITYETGVDKCHHLEDFNRLCGKG